MTYSAIPAQQQLDTIKRTLCKSQENGVFQLRHLRKNLTLLDFIERSLHASSIRDIYFLCEWLKIFYGFSFFGVGMLVPLSKEKNFYHVYDECKWNEIYVKNNFIVQDPFVAHCGSQNTPLIWQYNKSTALKFSDKNKVIQLARDFELKNTIALPLHGPHGVLSGMKLSTTELLTEKDINHILPMLVSCGQYIYEALHRIVTAEENHLPSIHLTDREREILHWSAIGKNSWEISQILKISENTTNTHLKNIFKKLNVHNRQHAIAKAISSQLIFV